MGRPEELALEEAVLARRAVAGDGDAFAELYGRYEQRAYNLCLRIVGSEEDAADATQDAFVKVLNRLPKLEGRDLAFGSYLFTSARHACYDLIERRRRAEPSDTIAESAITVGAGVGGGGTGFDPGDPDDDPERHVLLEAGQEEIREANMQLPERQREVLALRELEGLSYDEIAEIMDMNRNSVAQLISRARINLRDALRGTALASVAASSEDCRRALALLAAEQDGEAGSDGEWLAAHVRDCETCRLSREAMEEAGVSYRAWIPVAAAPLLFRETMARAAETVGADWSKAITRHEPRFAHADGDARGSGAAGPPAGPEGGEDGRLGFLRRRRRDLVLAAALALVLLLVVFAANVRDGSPVEEPAPVAEETPATAAEEPAPEEPKPAAKKRQRRQPKHEPVSAMAADPDEPVASNPDEPAGPATDTPSSRGPGGGDQPNQGRRGSARERGAGGGGDALSQEPPTDPPATEDPPPTDPPAEDPPEPPEPCLTPNGTPCVPGGPPVLCPPGGCNGPPPSTPPRP